MSIRAKPTFSLKDQLFNQDTVALLADALQGADESFDQQVFQADVLAKFPELELKQRIDYLVIALEKQLPTQFSQALAILHRALPAPLDPTKTDDDFGQFIWVVPGEYVAKWGCKAEHLDQSLAFLRESTQRFSAEGAIRPFLKRFPEQTLAFVFSCAQDDNYHVRRLASEGIRPLLPWAERVTLATDDIIQVLTLLHADPTRYVTRSVANTLNDISKSEPEQVISALKKWHAKGEQGSKELSWMTRHALRTLAKTDYLPALELLGFSPKPKFSLADTRVSKQVVLGDNLEWRTTFQSLAEQKVKLALKVHFLKANQSHSGKVFALKDVDLQPGDTLELNKNIAFKAATTRTLYPGTHYVELLVNGIAQERHAFEFLAG